ncbi:MAG: hypothetical protein LBS23_02060 [Holosporaceae bacterium]|jgi:hypothetical protein|nr:hypothetical protein [Holosporaceae bacterium]
MERFKIEASATPNHWICTDMTNRVTCVFKNGKFNETQKFSYSQSDDFQQLAKAAREMGDWLRENHYEKIFP